MFEREKEILFDVLWNLQKNVQNIFAKKKSCDKSYNLIIDSVVFASKAEIDIFGNKIQMKWL